MRKIFFYISGILFLGAFLCLNHASLFGEAEDSVVENPSSAEVGQAQETPAQDNWFSIKSRYFTIYYDNNVDLKKVSDRLERRGLFASGVYDPNPASAPKEKIAYRLDRILKRVKDILDMRPDIQDLKIRIFKDRASLNAEYCKIFNVAADYKSFYINQHKTIYTSEEDISDSVIAHEMGHAVVDHYFSVVPPEKVRELLASYVDLHLEEE